MLTGRRKWQSASKRLGALCPGSGPGAKPERPAEAAARVTPTARPARQLRTVGSPAVPGVTGPGTGSSARTDLLITGLLVPGQRQTPGVRTANTSSSLPLPVPPLKCSAALGLPAVLASPGGAAPGTLAGRRPADPEASLPVTLPCPE